MFRIVAFVGSFIKIHGPSVRDFLRGETLTVSVSLEWPTASCPLLSLNKEKNPAKEESFGFRN